MENQEGEENQETVDNEDNENEDIDEDELDPQVMAMITEFAEYSDQPKYIPTEDGDDPVSTFSKLKRFVTIHWQGLVSVLSMIIGLIVIIPWPGEPWQWCAYCLVVMAIYWVTECVPLAITSFIPLIIFPLRDIMTTEQVAQCYMNDTILVFLGSLLLAAAVEQSGLHMRLALHAIKIVGYSHYKLLFAMSMVTMFVSMWLTNTAATTMMVPINFALLRVFEEQNILSIYETNVEGEQIASDMTTCYFCASTFSATIGGIGTLVGTGTNLVFKGLFEKQYPNAEEYMTFPNFSAFSIPYMIIMELLTYFWMIVRYLGFLRPKSDKARMAEIPPSGIEAAKKTMEKNIEDLGPLSFWEIMVIILFGGGILLFFSRSPQIFPGWADRVREFYGIKDKKFIRDSVVAMGVSFLMFLFAAKLTIFKNCKVKFYDDLPRKRIPSVLDWVRTNKSMPWSFMFLLGGGFALSTAAKKEYTGLNEKIGEVLAGLKPLPNVIIILIVIIFTIFLTNFASNVAVANVVVPIGMTLATMIDKNPLLYNIAAGFSASYCFCLPVGTPGNLIVQSAAKIPTMKMIHAGLGPTLISILATWIAVILWAPVIWPVLNVHPLPNWTQLY
ncbi:protein I'm not dead yet-like [Pectinophora gossypiella]|uniref:protein I'm not dead yet-like n=1 Tax=Pectinophora gossypiella TaxID=13191 RepID=UPI00214F505D|nr:protein I'm not dead yet-like [Pectinophora gossypiella]